MRRGNGRHTRSILLVVLSILLTTAIAGIIALYKRVRALEAAAVVTDIKIQPFWALVQEKMVKDLTHPSAEFHEADELLAKLEKDDLSAEERARLLELMEQRVLDPNPRVGLPERETAGGLAFVMRKVEEEEASTAPIAEVRAVGIKKPEPSKEGE